MNEIMWNCAECGAAVGNGDGFLGVLGRDVHVAEQSRRESGPDTPLDLYGGSDFEARWEAHHYVCRTEEGSQYAVEVHRLRTPGAIIAWTAHLMEKTWLLSTDWDRILRRVAKQIGAGLG